MQAGIFHHLEAHLARLKRAAVHFGFPFDEAVISMTLQQLHTDRERESRHCERSAAVHDA